MQFIETAYITGSLVAILAAFPQLYQLFKTRQSDEFNVSTWTTWLVTQCVSLLYVSSLGNKLMIAVNIAWISFYFAMTVMIVYYHPARRRRKSRRNELSTELASSEE